ncbi:hypothetical protein Landi51_08955 [Colletotrichum acutatum]
MCSCRPIGLSKLDTVDVSETGAEDVDDIPHAMEHSQSIHHAKERARREKERRERTYTPLFQPSEGIQTLPRRAPVKHGEVTRARDGPVGTPELNAHDNKADEP